MDLLFAKALGDTAVVQTRACDDPRKGKGVFALVDLHDGEVVMRDSPLALLPSAELSEAAIEDARDGHGVCARWTGGLFLGSR